MKQQVSEVFAAFVVLDWADAKWGLERVFRTYAGGVPDYSQGIIVLFRGHTLCKVRARE